jgi:hypothetical protein
MPKFSTNNLLDKEEKKSRYAGLLVDQLDLKKENEFASNVTSLKEERKLRCQIKLLVRCQNRKNYERVEGGQK